MPVVDKWVDIYSDLRVWSATNETHKMGWLYAGDEIHLTEQYKTWFRFDQANGDGLNPLDDNYSEYWVKGDELEVAATAPIFTPEPDPESEPTPEPGPIPTQPEDTELGAAIRIVADFIFGYLRGWS